MNVPKIDWSCFEERRRWEEQNRETLLKWAALSFTEKIKIVEKMNEIARTFHSGRLPPSADEHEESSTL